MVRASCGISLLPGAPRPAASGHGTTRLHVNVGSGAHQPHGACIRKEAEAIMGSRGENRSVNHQPSELDARYARLQRKTTVLIWVCGGSALIAFTGNFLPDEWLGIPLVGLLVCLVTAWPAYR